MWWYVLTCSWGFGGEIWHFKTHHFEPLCAAQYDTWPQIGQIKTGLPLSLAICQNFLLQNYQLYDIYILNLELILVDLICT